MNTRFLPLLLSGVVVLSSCAPRIVIKTKPEPGKRFKVAVLPFKSHPDAPNSGETASEAFSTCILKVQAYDVVERDEIEKILKEQKLGMSGVIDQGQAIEIGKLAGVDGIVLGSVSKFIQRKYLMFPPAEVGLTARLVNTKTGLVEWTAQHRAGGAKRWLTLPAWPILIFLSTSSPTAEDQIQNAADRICDRLSSDLSRS